MKLPRSIREFLIFFVLALIVVLIFPSCATPGEGEAAPVQVPPEIQETLGELVKYDCIGSDTCLYITKGLVPGMRWCAVVVTRSGGMGRDVRAHLWCDSQ